jgi:hypothetical protein
MGSYFKIFIAFIICAVALVTGFLLQPSINGNINLSIVNADNAGAIDEGEIYLSKLNAKVTAWKNDDDRSTYNSSFIFLIDMSVPSGKPRFVVYNLKKDSIEIAGLVTHGSGSITGKRTLIFSNVPGSNCTSLGKYKIGNAYQGRFGLAYKLHGLNKTNDRAFERFIVLHAHECVPDGEVYPLRICASQGCPTVSPAFLLNLRRYIDASSKPVLMWVYQ